MPRGQHSVTKSYNAVGELLGLAQPPIEEAARNAMPAGNGRLGGARLQHLIENPEPNLRQPASPPLDHLSESM